MVYIEMFRGIKRQLFSFLDLFLTESIRSLEDSKFNLLLIKTPKITFKFK